MLQHRVFKRAVGLAIAALALLLGATTSTIAQDAEELAALDRVLTVSYESNPTAPPIIENGIFRLDATGPLTGDLNGTFTQEITQLCDCENFRHVTSINNLFTIEADEGTLKGYVIGYYYHPDVDSNSADYVGHGRVLSVTGSYADLYLADVYFNSRVVIENGQGVSDSGTITFAPRR